ncbi:Glycosyltransferase involved in cell wall bisynthesis [Methylobacterium gossipiicola]|uniref:Glycosyltransferase involved in cell wall bisynthesis n=2 Tax=Methylobacterium gossipiicola TaxID=582675 RepID=A0A1I2SZA5_9HYPH|nr:Glycosyltransferase involved in cell wall bisynthesis [Methylobacterium gossipiicola]
MAKPSLVILGTRGIPASHGGFETFAEKLALFLVRRGWHVAVYCQNEVTVVTERIRTSVWNGVELLHVDVASRGPKATLEFDWHCVRDAARRDGVCLVLGYNGAVFLPYLRLAGRKVLTNMDGIEWKRPKWSLPVRAWFWINEWIAAWSSQRLVADHPAIADHVATRRSRSAIATIPYGGDPIPEAPEGPIRALGLEPDRYLTSIARIEPDNNILTMVKAFSRQRRTFKLVVLGTLLPDNPYHAAVRAAASDEVMFPGAIFDAETLRSLRFHARAYLHGHTVGGTNPSLVEALWAGNAVIAHDNPFNRGTAGPQQTYFADERTCEDRIATAIADPIAMRAAGGAALARAAEHFDWTTILTAYEAEIIALGGYAGAPAGMAGSAVAR